MPTLHINIAAMNFSLYGNVIEQYFFPFNKPPLPHQAKAPTKCYLWHTKELFLSIYVILLRSVPTAMSKIVLYSDATAAP